MVQLLQHFEHLVMPTALMLEYFVMKLQMKAPTAEVVRLVDTVCACVCMSYCAYIRTCTYYIHVYIHMYTHNIRMMYVLVHILWIQDSLP